MLRRAKRPSARQSRAPRGSMGRAADGDCFECRVIGTTVCVGSSGAIAYELWAGAPRPPAHRYVMAAFAGGFLAMGVYRAVM